MVRIRHVTFCCTTNDYIAKIGYFWAGASTLQEPDIVSVNVLIFV